jgi:Domain of unknown function (DUF5666)
MKQVRAIFVVIMLAAMLLSACGASAAPAGSSKVEADILITGAIESINGTQWMVNGQTFTVDPAVVRDGPYHVGDVIKVEGTVQSDGTVVVTRVEIPTPEDLATATALANDNTNDDNSNDANINDVNSNDDKGNDSNSNDDNGNDSNSNDDSGNSNDDHGDNDNGGGSDDDNSNSNTNG